MKRYKRVDDYIETSDHWREELVQLRKVLLSGKLEETVKWGMPCYTLEGKMVVGLGAFKSFVALWFFQGTLLSDEKKLLINAQQGRTKAQRQWRFSSNKEINPTLIMSYVEEAIQLQVKGLQIKPERNKPLNLPSQLEDVLSKNEKRMLVSRNLPRANNASMRTMFPTPNGKKPRRSESKRSSP